MSNEIVRGTNGKPVSSGELAQILSGQTDLSGQLLIGYPIISTPEGRRIIDALLVCRDRGIINETTRRPEMAELPAFDDSDESGITLIQGMVAGMMGKRLTYRELSK